MRSIQSKNGQDHRTLLNTCGVLGQITFINSPGAKTMNSPLYLYMHKKTVILTEHKNL